MNKDKNKDKKKENALFVWRFGVPLFFSGSFAFLPGNWQPWIGIILGLALMIYSGYFYPQKEKADSQS
ncbi:MAG: hypothetical protein J6W21_09030 [Bacteroidaceae bacterium]|nr:hypothetical protein [Bacteroidaceae bacterium]